MTYKQALNKINKLLGLHSFNIYKIKETNQELVCNDNLAIDKPIYVITENGQLPAPDGEYELEDTTKIKIENGIVQEIKYDMEKKQTFVEATLKDGTVVKSPTFDVGEDVMVVSPDGTESPAPDGEHELMLKDTEGNEVRIKVITKDGKIVERENVELAEVEVEVGDETPEVAEEAADLSNGNQEQEDFKKMIMEKIDAIMAKIDSMVKDQEEMKSKFSKFSKEPAGNPVLQPKNKIQELNEYKNDIFKQLQEIRAKK